MTPFVVGLLVAGLLVGLILGTWLIASTFSWISGPSPEVTPMLHDDAGRPLRVGDRVTMTFEVLVIHRGEAAGQVTLVAAGAAGTAGAARPTITCDSRFVSAALAAAGEG